MAIESYDGMCGVIAPFGGSDLQLRCKHELGHAGVHSWEKYRQQFVIQSHCGPSAKQIAERGYIDSVLFHKK